MRVVFPRHLREICFARAVLVDVNLRDASEQFRKHEVAVFRFLVVIIGGRSEHIGAIKRRHCLLLLRSDNEDRVVKSAHDPLRAEQN